MSNQNIVLDPPFTARLSRCQLKHGGAQPPHTNTHTHRQDCCQSRSSFLHLNITLSSSFDIASQSISFCFLTGNRLSKGAYFSLQQLIYYLWGWPAGRTGRQQPSQREGERCPLGLIYEELPAEVITFLLSVLCDCWPKTVMVLCVWNVANERPHSLWHITPCPEL